VRTAIDTNVFSALWSREPLAEKMGALLGESRNLGGLVVCGVVYAELRAHPHASLAFVDAFLAQTDVQVEFDLDAAIWQEATRGFADYAARRRTSGGAQPKRLLADFMIAAHAEQRADRLLTLDPSRYAIDFPKLRLQP
jgi:predicted nucleic acid-binding protein